MLKNLLCRALPLAVLALSTSFAVAFAEDPAAAGTTGTTDPSATAVLAAPAGIAQPPALPSDTEHWTAHGFNIIAPSTIWPMLEELHTLNFDWELYGAQARPTPIMFAPLPSGVYGQYAPSQNVVKLSFVLQTESVELGTAFLAHELTHLNDDINGKLGNMTGDVCYAAETRAFVNEANFWEMVNGALGKPNPDAIEQAENAKMFAFVGNSRFADLVLRTTASYIKQCGS